MANVTCPGGLSTTPMNALGWKLPLPTMSDESGAKTCRQDSLNRGEEIMRKRSRRATRNGVPN
ncbi:hypothetical protein DSL92_04835 [Billgrantia gudaonensis]|uniref:Uncharacterized protein n=1 Tax=Billgrantia gudaonensis TaxID=376427 RepID=A0A3S0QFY4_9GAMM|nr:hypothetical protein DSL92_04835 [Halomonas gudaonensis]